MEKQSTTRLESVLIDGGYTALNAAYIARAVNAHVELLHALRQAELQLDRDWGIGKSPISKLVREAIARAEGREYA
jgi:hypothetical protein